MENRTLFEVARDNVRKKTVSVSIKEYNNFVNKSGSAPKAEASKAKYSRKK